MLLFLHFILEESTIIRFGTIYIIPYKTFTTFYITEVKYYVIENKVLIFYCKVIDEKGQPKCGVTVFLLPLIDIEDIGWQKKDLNEDATSFVNPYGKSNSNGIFKIEVVLDSSITEVSKRYLHYFVPQLLKKLN